MNYVRENSIAKTRWTIESIKKGFDQFVDENGRLPTTPEIDNLSYLPTSRTIQRNWGGVERLRKQLGYDVLTFSSGKFRSDISKKVGARGRDSEDEIEEVLVRKFGEVCVHVEKRFRTSNSKMFNSLRVDFYVYSPQGNFGVDIFCTDSFRDLEKNVNIKIDKYRYAPCKIFIVEVSGQYNQDIINSWLNNKRKQLPKNCEICSREYFISMISGYLCYPLDIINN